MTEHTPTPWKVSAGSTHIPGVCKFESIHGMYSNYEANAAFIVEAVNNYDRLRTELASARKALEDCQKALAAIIDPKAIKSTSVMNAFAQATEAECKARAALKDQPK